MSTVTTHVLDAALGKPAPWVTVRLEHQLDGAVAEGETDSDGRCSLGPDGLPAGRYQLVFDTGRYFASTGQSSCYPEVVVTFRLAADGEHMHLPLLLSPYAYSTYRGS